MHQFKIKRPIYMSSRAIFEIKKQYRYNNVPIYSSSSARLKDTSSNVFICLFQFICILPKQSLK